VSSVTQQLAELPLTAALPLPDRRRRRHPAKRTFDVVVGATMIAVTLPVVALIALLVKLSDGGPVFYRQRRVGRGGRPFTLVKFRTMVVGADRMLDAVRERSVTDGLLFKVPDDPRVTRLGRWLRRSCLDELPQLWNVLRGDMSLVGPRPIAADPQSFSPAEHERHRIRPGITGSWQVYGGQRRSYQEMIRLDLDYVRRWSLRRDVAILLRTLPVLVTRDPHG
jgi:lipopolysaccharide/colanic/teichoic acid biosynthesis glycosyltransferase